MNFSNKRFAEVFASLLPTGVASKLGGSERRRAQRIEVRHRTQLLLIGSSARPSIQVELRDLSVRGMKFVFAKPLPAGQQFIIAVPQLSGDSQLLLCTVVHSRKTEDGEIAIGAEFTCALPTPKPVRGRSSTRQFAKA